MTTQVTPTIQDVYTALKSFVQTIVPTGVPVQQGLLNRVAIPPTAPGFVVIQGLLKNRLRTTVDTWDTTDDDPTSMSSEQDIELTVQIDCYGAQSSDWADMISTLFRDGYGCNSLAPTCQPLYCDEARLIPLTDAESQYEERWVLTATLQYNPVVTTVQQFADVATATLIDVDEAYPPT